MLQALHPCVLLLLSRCGSWVLRAQRAAESQHRMEPSSAPIISAAAWICGLLAERKAPPQQTMKTLSPEGKSCFFAAPSAHLSVHAELSSLMPGRCFFLSDCPPSSLLPSMGSSWSFGALASHWLHLKGLVRAPLPVYQVLWSHQREVSLRPETFALPLCTAPHRKAWGHCYPSKAPLFLPYQGPPLRKG